MVVPPLTTIVWPMIPVSAGRARDFPQKPLYLLGPGESGETPMALQASDWLACVSTGVQSEFCGLRDRPVRTPRKRDTTAD
jgi:hypothetical protein